MHCAIIANQETLLNSVRLSNKTDIVVGLETGKR